MCYLVVKVLLSLSILVNFAIAPNTVAAAGSPAAHELISGYVTIIDDQGNILLQTGHEVHVGDEYISEDNVLYEITALEGMLARCRPIENFSGHITDNARFVQAPPPEMPKPKIAVYHSHTDESYIPNDGTPSQQGKGSIMIVGDAFEKRLTELGYEVVHSKNLHDPHDANAYHRSRRTAMKLLQEQPIAIFDIHRDSAPLRAYSATINGETVSRLLLVVGRQNQNQRTTLDFARSIKAATDAKYRGLIRGIFIAHGNYNQDLSPRALLIEAGTQYNNREAAERSIALFADCVPAFLGPVSVGSNSGVAEANQAGTYTNTGTNGGVETVSYVPPDSAAPGYDILGITLAVVIGSLAFLFLSTGSWQEAKKKLAHFFNQEFANFLGPFKKRKK
ncbi:stage II sporulation protein P [Sporomusa acidovorans]|uniref:Stage II sporulation protein P n=1 Tax=Sporomusa acidovorans (strain ATCC 49682 / DSM 3132 / Mol) TaxID=1123286 RepID=A0ABZ3IXB0_SPOA4|nr:stage II sporulation protein P [Sporomusa acidovorans]OZC13876.1 stage II sporulation protein SpoIIP [Sporomusa acidovorans DSM 3132]SDF48639.1 stage II sporulation protein P [Sporomusa acidovorans]